jgi:hypothetical protein
MQNSSEGQEFAIFAWLNAKWVPSSQFIPISKSIISIFSKMGFWQPKVKAQSLILQLQIMKKQ